MLIIKVEHQGKLISIIIKNSYSEDGITFVTPNNFSQQLAYMKHPAGKLIDPHLHNPVERQVLFIKRGKLKVNFFDDQKNFIESHILEEGDAILLASGGHGFEVLEEIEMFEVKQGPYLGEHDKTRFKHEK